MSKTRILDHRTPEERDRSFLPGMGRTWLLPVYDVMTRVAGVREVHERTVALAGLRPGQDVIDVGCGTGNLSLAALAARPDARLTGLDPDAAALRRAARKARRRGVSLTLVQGFADRLPAEDASLDHVISSLAFHHVDEDGRARFASEACRALRPGGRITVADFGGPSQGAEDAGHAAHSQPSRPSQHRQHSHGPGHAVRHLRSLMRSRVAKSPGLAGNLDNGLVTLLTGAGFADAREVDHLDHPFGRVAFVQATRP